MPVPKGAPAPQRQLLADGLYEELLAAIVSGELEPGETVSEVAIANLAGVSRTPAREALDRLAAISLVEVKPRRGSQVTPLDPARTRHTLEALLPLCVESVKLVTDLASDRERRGITARIDQLDPTLGSDLFRVDGLFEYVVVAVANSRMWRTWNDLVPHVRRHWTIEPTAAPAGFTADATGALRDAVTSGDHAAAAATVRAWFDDALRTIEPGAVA